MEAHLLIPLRINELVATIATLTTNHPVPITTQKITQSDYTTDKDDDAVTDMLIDTESTAHTSPITNTTTKPSPTITAYITTTENNPEKENKNTTAHDITDNITAPPSNTTNTVRNSEEFRP